MLSLLVATGWILTAVFATLIIVPWLMGRRHLMSVWTFFLLGSINFLSMGMVQNARGINPGAFDDVIPRFITAMLVFYGIVAGIYLYPMRKPLQARLPAWPEDSDLKLAGAAVLMSLVGIAIGYAPAFPGVQVLYIVNGPMCIAGFCLAIILLRRRPFAISTWLILAFTFLCGLFNVFTFGTGRRELLALFLALPIAGYWMWLRNQKKVRSVIALGVLASAGILVVTSYASFRHADRHNESSTALALSRIQKIPQAVLEQVGNFTVFGEVGSVIDGQNAVFVGLLTLDFIDSNALEQEPLHALTFIASNPIPRSVWPGKPIGLGKILPVSTGNYRITWGPSIIGHCFYDGGWPVLVFYACLLGGFIRYVDQRLLQDPENPWQIALLASVVGHVLGFARGDCGTFAVNILGPVVVISACLHVSRHFVGARLPRWFQTPEGARAAAVGGAA